MLDANNTYFSKLAGNNTASEGMYKALWAFRNSIARSTDELEVRDLIWGEEIKDFVTTIRTAGIQTFVVTTHSSGLMEMLHKFAENGCTLEGLATIRRAETEYSDAEQVNGLRFKVN